MARYDIPEERIVIIGGRDDKERLLLEDQESRNVFVSNPPVQRRPKKKEYIELPMGQYEDLRVRIGLVRSPGHGKYPKVQVGGSEDVATLMRPMSHEPQEVLSVILLDMRNTVVGICEIGRGGVGSALVEPQNVFKPALLANAVAIIIVHNHPSGDPGHSQDDIDLCKNLLKAADILGIRMLDFVIIGHDRHEGFADMGLV